MTLMCGCSRSRPVGLCVDPSDDDQEVWALLDPLSVVCCRLQTLVEARSDGRPATTGGDVRWQAGLLASVAKATQRLQVLAAGTTSSAGSRGADSFTVSYSLPMQLYRRADPRTMPALTAVDCTHIQCALDNPVTLTFDCRVPDEIRQVVPDREAGK